MSNTNQLQRLLDAISQPEFPAQTAPATELGQLIKKSLIEDPKALQAMRQAVARSGPKPRKHQHHE